MKLTLWFNFFSFVLILNSAPIFAQETAPELRGQIIESDTKIPILGARIFLTLSDSKDSTLTDEYGQFSFANVSPEAINLTVHKNRFESIHIRTELISGKQKVLQIEMTPTSQDLELLVVSVSDDPSIANNEMSLVGARKFSVSETKRYAGTLDDPARAVANFPGVVSDAQGTNSIIVRGNSPKGILWRIDGVEIPNPNHFADEGSTGGPVSALSNTILSNADFMTGAFAPEYGNALSGIFDLRMRQGNNEKKEHSASIGLLGTAFGTEGPINKKKGSSYIMNYRYSTLGLVENLGFTEIGGNPKYQDLAFKLQFPGKNQQHISVFGLGGINQIVESQKDSSDQLFRERDFGSQFGVLGIQDYRKLGTYTSLTSTLLFTHNGSNLVTAEQDTSDSFVPFETYDKYKNILKGNFVLNHRFNAQNRLEAGLIYSQIGYQLHSTDQEERSYLNDAGATGYAQGYVSWKHQFSPRIIGVAGAHYMHLLLNNSNSIEPRFSLQWKVSSKQKLSFGVGQHSRMESFSTYFSRTFDSLGIASQPNVNLGFTKARHLILEYDLKLSKTSVLEVDLFYQHIYNVPVENDSNSTYSLSNAWWEIRKNRMLVNQGTGLNYGMEISYRQFLTKGFYFISSASLYQSKYQSLEGVWRNTEFNAGHRLSIALGKQYKVGKSAKHKTLGLHTSLSHRGGGWFTPIDLEASLLQNKEIQDETSAYSVRGANVSSWNISIRYKVNRPKTTHTVKFEILNALNNDAGIKQYYNKALQTTEFGKQIPFLPNLVYRVFL